MEETMSGMTIAKFEKQMKKEAEFFNRRGGGTDIPPMKEVEIIEDFSSTSNSNSWGGLLVEELGDQRDSDHLAQAFSQCKSMGISY